MTKVLSQILGVGELEFRQMVAKLERASGNQGYDINLSSKLQRMCQIKIASLGLDPNDTTPKELYYALMRSQANDENKLKIALNINNDSRDSLETLVKSINRQTNQEIFTLKSSAAKRLLKSRPPKKALKKLGYRSLDSFIKHEPLAGIFTAARICESEIWWHNWYKDYKKLRPGDFENREIAVAALVSSRWQKLAAEHLVFSKNNIFSFKELGIISALPLDNYPEGMLTAIYLLIASEISEISAASSFLKIRQVKTDFGEQVAVVASRSVFVESRLFGNKLDWRAVHNFVRESGISLDPQLDSIARPVKSPADTLASLSPALEFWHGTSHLAYCSDGQIVSLNPLDVCINLINHLPYEQSIGIHFKTHLWNKFWEGYLQAEVIGERLIASLQRELAGPELALEPIVAE